MHTYTNIGLGILSVEGNSLKNDLIRCSQSMGVSEARLREDTDNIERAIQSAQRFIDAVHLVVPEPSNFTIHKNPSFYSNVTVGNYLSNILISFLRPETGKGAENLRKLFTPKQLLTKVTPHKSLMCLPYFYIAGFPKCATTSLHEALLHHPQIVAPDSKEPHWWTRVKDLSDYENAPQDFDTFYVWTYLLFFKDTCEKIERDRNDSIITYDGSQSLLWDSNFFQNGQDYCAMPAVLSRIQPKAKFIVIMRNPTIRLYSHFIWSFKYHFGNLKKWPDKIRQNASESFHSEVVSVTNEFKNCLKSLSLFECASGSKSPMDRLKKSVSQIRHKFYIGLYYVHVKKWLQFYPREQFLFLRMEDMVTDFASTMTKIVEFLELSRPVAREEIDKWLTRVNTRSSKVTSDEKWLMQSQTKALLNEVYGPYNQLLADLLDDERYMWSDVAE